MYDKFGGVSFCIGPDGEEYPADRGADDPCEEPACPGGYISAAGELICPEEDCPGGFMSPSGEFICPEDIPDPSGREGGDSRDPNRGSTTNIGSTRP